MYKTGVVLLLLASETPINSADEEDHIIRYSVKVSDDLLVVLLQVVTI